MKQKKRENLAAASVGSIVVLIIIGLIILAIVRSGWLAAANRHYDKMISAYISQMEDYEAQDRDKLKKRLLEDGIFIKMNKWGRESFVKDKQLYNEMIKKYNEQQREKEEAQGGLAEDLINL